MGHHQEHFCKFKCRCDSSYTGAAGRESDHGSALLRYETSVQDKPSPGQRTEPLHYAHARTFSSHWHGVRQNFRRRGFIRGFSFFLIFRPILIPWFWILLFSNIFRREEIEVCIFWWNQCNQILNISNPVKNQIQTKNMFPLLSN